MKSSFAELAGRRLKKKNQCIPIEIFSPTYWIIIPLLLFFLASVSLASTDVGGTISADTTWSSSGSPYIVTSSVYVIGTDGADGITTLTIEPGVEVRFNRYTKLGIGAGSGDPGALVAEGTVGSPILFTSNAATPVEGDYYGIQFQNTTDDDTTSLSNCIVEYAGCANQGSVYVYSSSPELHDSIIRYGSSYGVYMYSGNPILSNVTISDIANYGLYFAGTAGGSFTGNTIANGLYLTSGSPETLSENTFNWNNSYPIRIGCNDVGTLLNNNTLNGLDESSYLDVVGGTLTLDADWPHVLPLRVTSSLTVKGTDGDDNITTLTIEPGVEVRFNKNTKLEIGAGSGDPGALVAEGTTADPVLFTSNETSPAAGDWYGVRFQNTTDDATTSLSNCIVEYAGYANQGSVYVYYSAPELQDSIIRYGSSYGVYVYSGNPTLSNVTISDINNYGLYFAGTAGGSFTNNTIEKGFYLTSGGFDALTGNTFNWDNTYPIRIGCDNVGQLVNNNTLANLDANSYLEVNGGTITKDSTWTASIPYRILSQITIQGTDGADGVTTLTIEPGVIVRFNSTQSIAIGSSSGDPGALVAEGTAAEPIVFTSAQTIPVAGDWYGIRFLNTTHDVTTRLSQCIVEYATYGKNTGSLYIYNSSPTIENTTVRYSSKHGIVATGTSSPTVTGCTISDVASYGLYFSSVADGSFTNNTIEKGFYLTSGGFDALTGNTFNWDNTYPIRVGCDYVGQLVNNNTLANLDANSYLEVNGGTITKDSTWTASIPYRILSQITIQGTDGADGVTTLTIEPGVIVRFNSTQLIAIGSSSGDPGALVAEGTAAEPIVFTSAQTIPVAGDWYGIRFLNTTHDVTTRLSQCIVEYATYGKNTGSLYIYNSSPTIENTTVRYSSKHGIVATGTSSPTVTGCTISDVASYGLYFSSVADGSFTNNTIEKGFYLTSGGFDALTGNTFNWDNTYPIRIGCDYVGQLVNNNTLANLDANSYLEVNGGTITKDSTWTASIPYRILSQITIQGTDGADGVTTLTIEPGVIVRFNSTQSIAIGSSSGDPGALVAEGTAAEPIVFTSAQTIPVAGDWYGIRFLNTTHDVTTRLSQCIVEYATYGKNTGSLYIYNSSPTIENTTVRYSSKHGIVATGTSSPTVTGCTISDVASYGLYFSSVADGSFTNNTIEKGFYLTSGGFDALTGNTFNWDNTYPIRIGCDNVGQLVNNNTFANLDSNSYLDVIGGTITKDSVWPALLPYRILSQITIQGIDGADGVTALTLDPGVTMQFNPGQSITIGNSSGSPGALVAEGTSGSPIVFTSNQPTPATGDWNGIYFANTADDSQCLLSHCEVGYAGISSYGGIRAIQSNPVISDTRIHHSPAYGLSANNADITLAGCEIDNNGSHGIYISSCAPDIIGTDFHDNGDFDIYYAGYPTGGIITGNTIRNGIYVVSGTLSSITGNTIEYNDVKPANILAELVGEFLNDNTITDITSESTLHVWGSSITQDATWPALMPVHMRSSVTVQGTDGLDEVTTLTIGPGAILKFDTGKRLTIGGSSGDPGAVVADGSQETIVFTSAQETPAAGDWDRIQFSNTSDDGISLIKNCIFEYGGSGNYGTLCCVDASPTVLYCQFSNNAHAGLYLSSGGSSNATIGNNDFSGNLYGIYLAGNAQPILDNNNFLGNTNYGLYNASSVLVTAENNWWGDPGGPSAGDAVYGNVDFDPWSTSQSAGWITAEFSAFPETTNGGVSTLTWSTANATSVSIEPEIGAVALIGDMEVSPGETTIYTLTATGPAGSVSKDATVTVYIVTGPEDITYEYDALGRITRIIRNPGSGN